MLCGLQKRKHSLCSILRLHLRKLTGADGDEATPVPIPNTEVKLISVENTWLETAWEDRAMPAQEWLLSVILTGAFLRIEMLLACFRNS